MFKKIPRDKWKHFIVGIGMGVFLQGLFFHALHLSIATASIWSISLSIVISYGFELFSLITGKGHYEVLDAVAGVLGAAIGMAVVTLIYF
jgi:glycopeptide antibiotics resistance protein